MPFVRKSNPHEDDVKKAVLNWVRGNVVEYNRRMGLGLNTFELERYVSGVYETVWSYLRGRTILGGRCSDLECELGLEAAKIFGKFQEEAVAQAA